MVINDIALELISESDLPYLEKKMEESFSVSVKEHFGENKKAVMPPSEELENAYNKTNNKVYFIMKNEQPIGGAVLKINEETRHNKLELFFIFKEYINQGLGLDAWKAIEREYPQTLVWELETPYFEQRNIHFYINKCGFHIVEYFNKYHPNPMMPARSQVDESEHTEEFDDGGCFRFVKCMVKEQSFIRIFFYTAWAGQVHRIKNDVRWAT